MNISLTPDLEQFIENQINSGKCASYEEVIKAALQKAVMSKSKVVLTIIIIYLNINLELVGA